MAVKRKKKKEYVYLCGKKLTIPEFRAEIHKRGKGPFFTQEEFDKEINEWLKKEICK